MATEAELKEFLRKNAPAKQFVPYCYMNEASDSLTVYFEGDADYSVRLTDHVTVYRSLETNEVVGCRIKGVSDILHDLPNYIQINDDSTHLQLLFLAFRGGDNKQLSEAMNDLARSAKKKKMVLSKSNAV